MKDLFPAIAIICAVQFTDLKFLEIKVGDVISIMTIIYFVTSCRNVPFPAVYQRLLFVFTISFGVSLITLSWIKLYPPADVSSLLKAPVWISVSRYIQYIGCVFFALFAHSILYRKSRVEQQQFILLIDRIMFGFGLFFMAFWILGLAGIKSPFTYAPNPELSTIRLAGGYVEGGPFGLLYAFYAMVRFRILGFSVPWLVLDVAIIIAAESKSAVFFFAVAYIYNYVFATRTSIGHRLGFITAGVLAVFISTQLFDMSGGLQGYQDSVEGIEKVIAERPDDGSLVMGRIAASFIGPKIFKDNMLFGVGIGNYSLTRNNPDYLGIFPAVTGWDLPGFGGIPTYLLECGLFGTVLFLVPLGMFFFSQNPGAGDRHLIVFFVLALTFVQMHFQYPWLALSFASAFDRKQSPHLSPAAIRLNEPSLIKSGSMDASRPHRRGETTAMIARSL